MLIHTPLPEMANHEGDEKEQLKFVLLFRELIRTLVKLNTFDEFEFDQACLGMSKETYVDFLSKYTAIARELRTEKQKVSILNDISFDLELIRTDKFNVHYILDLIRNAVREPKEQQQKSLADITNMIEKAVDPELHLKADLIKGFITRVVPSLSVDDDFDFSYEQYMQEQRKLEINEMSVKYNISQKKMNDYISDYEFGGLIDTNDIKANLTKEVIQKEREEKGITGIKAKNLIATIISEFIRDLRIKYM